MSGSAHKIGSLQGFREAAPRDGWLGGAGRGLPDGRVRFRRPRLPESVWKD